MNWMLHNKLLFGVGVALLVTITISLLTGIGLGNNEVNGGYQEQLAREPSGASSDLNSTHAMVMALITGVGIGIIALGCIATVMLMKSLEKKTGRVINSISLELRHAGNSLARAFSFKHIHAH